MDPDPSREERPREESLPPPVADGARDHGAA